MQIILRGLEGGGGGIIDWAHIKLFRTLTTDLQKGLASLAANPLRALHLPGHRVKVTLACLKGFVEETVTSEGCTEPLISSCSSHHCAAHLVLRLDSLYI